VQIKRQRKDRIEKEKQEKEETRERDLNKQYHDLNNDKYT
jgi:hypothetical protein